jgi:phage gpG-like protein
MPGIVNLLQAAHHFHQLGVGWPKACHQALEIAARIVEGEAKRLIGTYNAQPRWPPLAESTLSHKAADTPLLETGELRNSIQHSSSPTVAHIGSNNPKAIWMELGTSRVPARSFLASALHAKEKLIVRAIGETVRDFITSVNLDGEFLHLAIRAFEKIVHSLREAAEELSNDNTDHNSRRRR